MVESKSVPTNNMHQNPSLNFEKIMNEYLVLMSFTNIWKLFFSSSPKKGVFSFAIVTILIMVCSILSFINVIFDVDYIVISSNCLTIIIFILLIIDCIVVFVSLKGLQKLSTEIASKLDTQFYTMLSNNNIDFKNIPLYIQYYEMILEPQKKFYIDSPISDSIRKSGQYLLTLLFGIMIPTIIKHNSDRNMLQTFSILFSVVIFISGLVLVANIYSFIFKKDRYLIRVQNFVIDLKKTYIKWQISKNNGNENS